MGKGDSIQSAAPSPAVDTNPGPGLSRRRALTARPVPGPGMRAARVRNYHSTTFQHDTLFLQERCFGASLAGPWKTVSQRKKGFCYAGFEAEGFCSCRARSARCRGEHSCSVRAHGTLLSTKRGTARAQYARSRRRLRTPLARAVSTYLYDGLR